MQYRDYVALYRRQCGLTWQELADKSGVPKTTLDKIMSGSTKSPTLDTAKRIAVALGRRVDDFIEYEVPGPISGTGDGEELNRQFRDLWRQLPPAGQAVLLRILESGVSQIQAQRVSDRRSGS